MFLHVLDDLGDFHTKSLFLVFNFWEVENLLFLVFNVLGPSGTQIGKAKNCTVGFSPRERQWEKDRREKSHEGQERGGPRGQRI